jgi:hypothetical protein
MVIAGEAVAAVGAVVPFAPRTTWAVARDGRVAIVRPEPYRVDVIQPTGQRRDGHEIQHIRVRVGEALKNQWRDTQTARLRNTTVSRDGSSATSLARPPAVEPLRWPAFLPPFLDDVLFSPDGLLWIPRTTDIGSPPYYDVIDHENQITARMTLRPHSRIAGFSTTSIYVARADADGFEFLERYDRLSDHVDRAPQRR